MVDAFFRCGVCPINVGLWQYPSPDRPERLVLGVPTVRDMVAWRRSVSSRERNAGHVVATYGPVGTENDLRDLCARLGGNPLSVILKPDIFELLENQESPVHMRGSLGFGLVSTLLITSFTDHS